MGLDARNLSLGPGVYEHQRRKPACAYAQSDQRLCYSLNEKYHIWGPTRGFGEQGNKTIYFKGTGEQMPFFRGTGEQAVKFGEHKIMCANDINTVIKNLFFLSILAKAKFQFSSWSLQLSRLVWISLCRKPRRQVLFRRGPLTYHIGIQNLVCGHTLG